jgi:hypothetical protein
LADSSAITGQAASRTISVIRSSACSECRHQPDERDVRPLSRGHRPDLLDLDLACDDLVPEPGHDLGEQLEPLAFLVGYQDTEPTNRVLGHGPKWYRAA